MFPLIVVYNEDSSKVLFQVNIDYKAKHDHIQAVLFKGGILIDVSESAKQIAKTLPMYWDNSETDLTGQDLQTYLENTENEIDAFKDKEQGLGDFVHKPLVDQFNELFRITEDPIGKVIKNMESKGDDKYASFNPEDVEFYPNAFDDEI